MDAIVVINAGSSSLKFSLFAASRRRARARRARPGRGPVHAPRFVAQGRATARVLAREVVGRGRRARPRRRARAPRRRPARAVPASTGWSPSAIASSTAGSSTASPCASTPAVLAALEKFIPLAPLHQPHNLAPIRALLERSPALAAGRVLRHRVPPRPAGGRADVRAAEGDHRPRRAALRLPRPVLRVHRAGAAALRRARGRRPDRRAAPRQRRQHVRDRGGQERREHDGLHRGRRPADGHALRQHRSGRGALPDGRARDGRARDREADLQAVGAARRVRHLQRHAHAGSERGPGARSRRSTSSSTASGASSARSPRRSAGSTRSCSPPASARTAASDARARLRGRGVARRRARSRRQRRATDRASAPRRAGSRRG